jgi:thiamine pyrophosphokinase
MSTGPTDAVLIVGGGVPPDPKQLHELVECYPFTMAADSGLAALVAAGMEPDLVVGDFDSVKTALLAEIPIERHRPDTSPAQTDLEKCIRRALELGAKRIGLAGVSGNRIDHTLNAVSLMVRYEPQAEMRLYDAAGVGLMAKPPGISFGGTPGDLLSICPAPAAFGLQSEGLKFPLENLDLEFGGRDGISNELALPEARITFRSGFFLLYRQTP